LSSYLQLLLLLFSIVGTELLICGLPTIDLADFRAHTNYTGYQSTDKQMNWFWQIVEEFSEQDRALLVLFITGTSKIPLEGFKALSGSNGVQPVQIQRAAGEDLLPTAHTW
jgi:E3 ubiquitin-protein ligase HUWE1